MRLALTLLLTLVALAVEAQETPAPRALALYVGAHQDDWQLFRGNAAAADLRDPDVRVVFVYASAGDAGRTDGWWEARERGAIEAVRAVTGPAPLVTDVVELGGHPVVRHRVGASTSYVLRLPDGRWRGGDGYASTGNESLSQLRDSARPVSAVDGSTVYTSWDDVVGTLRALVEAERGALPAEAVTVHAPDYAGADNADPECAARPGCNPCDHPDHTAVADAVRAAVDGAYRRVWWVGYDSSSRPDNLEGEPFRLKGLTFFGYADAVREATARNGDPALPSLDEWRLWGTRDYVRTVGPGEPDVEAPICDR